MDKELDLLLDTLFINYFLRVFKLDYQHGGWEKLNFRPLYESSNLEESFVTMLVVQFKNGLQTKLGFVRYYGRKTQRNPT